jgi:hypothetical protein
MARATPILHPACQLAKFYSRKRVLEAAKAAGIRPSSLGAAEINARAVAYCEAHREKMIGKAIEAIQHSPKLRQLGQMRGHGPHDHAFAAPRGTALPFTATLRPIW